MIANEAHFRNRLAALGRLINKSVEEMAVDVMRLGVEQAIRLTAPFNKGQSFTEALGAQKRLGEAAVRRDIRRVFHDEAPLESSELLQSVYRVLKTDGPQAAKNILESGSIAGLTPLEAPTQSVHNKTRIRGRVPERPSMRYPVQGGLDAYIRTKVRNVGKTKAGWIPAARQLKAARKAMPAWVTRHSSPGSLEITRQGDRVVYRAVNRVWYVGFSKAHRDIETRVARSMQNNIEKRIVKVRAAIKRGWRPNAAA
jgi:hypothetical protein